MKQFIVLTLALVPFSLFAQTTNAPTSRQQKAAERRERINNLIKQEEEGALIYQKQGAFGVKLNTDGYGVFYEHGKYKTITKTNIWWMELGEHKDKHEEKTSVPLVGGGFVFLGNPYIYGKENNFYNFKIGLGQQRLIGGKGNKNGVAVSAIYGGGFSLGMLKPYYLQVQDPNNANQVNDIKYSDNPTAFLDYTLIQGSSGFTKGLNEIKYVPGAQVRGALRFDYGRYNELLSALEVGVNVEYYTQNMPIMVNSPDRKLFFNAYVAIVFGRRK